MRLIFAFLLLPFLLTAQVPESEWNRAVRRVDTDRKADVQLPKEEMVGVLPNARSLATGNWGYGFLQVPQYEAQIKQKTVRKVRVVILDTGIPTNRYLQWCTNLALSFSTTGEPNSNDLNGHATHCGGIVAGKHPNQPLGIATPLGSNIELVFGKVLTHGGSGSYVDIIEGVDRAVEISKDGTLTIISMSLGGNGDNAELQAAIARAEAAGVFVVAATGNTGSRGVQIPGKYAYGVGALGVDGKIASFSTFGPEVDASAPGVGILSTYKDTLAELSGTSMATPHIAAIAALIASCNVNITANDLRTIRTWHVDVLPAGFDEKSGFGYITASAINLNGVNPPPPPPPAEPPVPKRTLTIPLSGGVANWHYLNQPVRQMTVASMTVEINSTKPDAQVYDQLLAATNDYWKWTLVPRDGDGYATIAGYVGHFYNLIVGRQNDCRVVALTAKDDNGRTIQINKFPTVNTNVSATSIELIVGKKRLRERLGL